MFLVDSAHESSVRRDRVGAKQKESLFRGEFDALANDIVELTHRQVCRNKILLLVNVGDITSIGLFANDGDAVRILGPDALGFALSLLLKIKRNMEIEVSNSNKIYRVRKSDGRARQSHIRTRLFHMPDTLCAKTTPLAQRYPPFGANLARST